MIDALKFRVNLGAFPTVLQHQFDFITTTLDSDCKTFQVHIRYYCTEDPNMAFSSKAEFDRVCNEVIDEGLKMYYGGELDIDGVTYYSDITTEVTKKQTRNSQPIVLKNQTGDCVGKSNNNVVFPINGHYCDDIQFRYTIAHEFGHAMLIPAEGIDYSATHKGTSTLSQVPRNDSDVANCDGSVVFDLMHYFKEYNENCYENGTRGPPFYLKAMASESDKQTLAFHAEEQIQESSTCGAIYGASCASKNCLDGLKCEPTMKVCVECLDDSHCDSETQYCHDKSNYNRVNKCLDKRRAFEPCDRDRTCLYGYCNRNTWLCGSKGEQAPTQPTENRASVVNLSTLSVLVALTFNARL